MTKTSAAPAAMVRLTHEDACSCSVGGEVFAADENGEFTVPADAAEALAAHGFFILAVPARIAPAEG